MPVRIEEELLCRIEAKLTKRKRSEPRDGCIILEPATQSMHIISPMTKEYAKIISIQTVSNGIVRQICWATKQNLLYILLPTKYIAAININIIDIILD